MITRIRGKNLESSRNTEAEAQNAATRGEIRRAASVRGREHLVENLKWNVLVKN